MDLLNDNNVIVDNLSECNKTIKLKITGVLINQNI